MDLRSSSIINPEIEGHYAFFPFVEQIATREHRHDFYEIFLVINGTIYHHINSEVILLNSGALVFIRPNDAHFFSKRDDQNCELINLAFLSGTFDTLVEYLGLDLHNGLLVTSHQSTTVQLTVSEKNHVTAQLKEWSRTMYGNKLQARVALRALLAHLIVSFFVARYENHLGNVPHWLSELCLKMQQKEHTVEGRKALMRLANRTPEYVGRTFKTYLGITPSQFINDLRLDYANDLLLHTEQPVIDICYDVGFENLSYFYRLFKVRWQCSPAQFRKMHQRVLVP